MTKAKTLIEETKRIRSELESADTDTIQGCKKQDEYSDFAHNNIEKLALMLEVALKSVQFASSPYSSQQKEAEAKLTLQEIEKIASEDT